MHNQAAQDAQHVEWFHPGEVVIVARSPRGALTDEQLRTTMRDLLGRHAREDVSGDSDSLRSFVFDAPTEPLSLVFFVQKLTQAGESRAVKNAVERLHGQLSNLRANNLEVIGAMPQWHLRAHEAYSGGSPGSLPAPVFPDHVHSQPARRVYRPASANLDLAERARDAAPVRIAVLDTRIDLDEARQRAEHFRSVSGNQQLLETVDWLREQSPPDSAVDDEWQMVRQHHADLAQATGPGEPPYRMADHGLFVAGLIHGVAPRARVSYEPVLDEMGLGDISLLLLGLQRLLRRKRPDEPQIVNLSLGFRPHPSRLPSAWYGLPRPHDAMYAPAASLFDQTRDVRWVTRHRGEVGRTVDMLQAGLGELGRYLSLNNCLVVAAAGNDSHAGSARLEPRLPARFETVLGVAATTSDPRVPAPYSNLGDQQVLGDHVATFGGGITDGLQPRDGVIGIYSGEFPKVPNGQSPANDTGWAYWSGTSFATALVSGIAANFWALNPTLHAVDLVAELHDAAAESGPFVPELRTPSIEIPGEWRT